jgi:hypothetical protein
VIKQKVDQKRGRRKNISNYYAHKMGGLGLNGNSKESKFWEKFLSYQL